jgi:hypothetical protein
MARYLAAPSLQRTEALLWTMALLLLFVVTPYLEIQR